MTNRDELQSEKRTDNRYHHNEKHTASQPGGGYPGRIRISGIPFLDRVGSPIPGKEPLTEPDLSVSAYPALLILSNTGRLPVQNALTNQLPAGPPRSPQENLLQVQASHEQMGLVPGHS